MEKKQSKLIKYGDTFNLGNHLLLCGDCRDIELIDNFLKNKKIRSVITDPPYGVKYVENKRGLGKVTVDKNIRNDDISSESEYKEFTEKWLIPLLPHLEEKNNFYIFNSDKFLTTLIGGIKNQDINFSQLLIWIKNNSVIGRKDYLIQHELIIVGWYKKHLFRKSKDKSIIFCPKPIKSTLHPTMKPISLLRRLILNSSNAGDYIYDPFGGSGSTLIASEQTQRKCLTVEIDPHYCEIIINRYEDYAQKGN